MSKAEQSIRKHIEELDAQMESVMSYEFEMEEMGMPLSQSELENNDRKWMQLAIRKHELQEILAEIINVDVHALMC